MAPPRSRRCPLPRRGGSANALADPPFRLARGPEERSRARVVTAPQLCWAGFARLAAVVCIVAVLVMLTAPFGAVVPRATAGEPGATPFVRVRIDQVTPDVVTTTSPPLVTVSGMVTNVGDRPVRDVMVRLEHAGAVTGSAGLRTSLDGSTDQYQAAADFLTVSPSSSAARKRASP